jgi:predicted nucleotidyltransferase
MSGVEMLRKKEDAIKDRYGLKRIGIFGSFTRGEEREGSDIDILVEFNEGRKTFDNYMDLKYFLQDLFRRDVDLVTAQALKPQLKEDILHEVIYA